MHKRLALGVGALAVAILAVVTAASYQEAQTLLRHRGVRPRVTPADSGLTYETVPFAASDGTRLEGWWIVPKDGVRRRDLATVILCHPEDDSFAVATGISGKARMLRFAAPLARAGFIVLAFDFRSYGGSAGAMTTGGYLEQHDLAGALQFAHARCLGAHVALVGEGMGGTVVLAAPWDRSIATAVAIAPRRSWNDALLGRARAAGDGAAWARALGARPLVAFFAARAMPGEFDGEKPGVSAQPDSSPDLARLVLADEGERSGAAEGAVERRVAEAIARRFDSPARLQANIERAERADSTARARDRVDSLSAVGRRGPATHSY